jgi:hypothetical protein
MSTETKPANAAVNRVADKAPVIDYNLAEDGTITRTDKDSTITVATLKEDNTLVIAPEWLKFRAPIVRFLNEDVGRTPSAVYTEGDEPSPKAKARDIPPMPKKSMRLGDKTPEVVEWYKRYKPEEYRALYGIIGEGTVTKARKVLNPKTGIPETEIYEAEAIIATRKTHLTEKPEANKSIGDSEYSD